MSWESLDASKKVERLGEDPTEDDYLTMAAEAKNTAAEPGAVNYYGDEGEDNNDMEDDGEKGDLVETPSGSAKVELL